MLKYLLEKEFKQFLRNRFLPKFAIVFPFAILSIFPLVTNTEIKNIRLCVVDNDKSGYAYRLTEKIKSSGYFILKAVTTNEKEAFELIESHKIDIILEIPSRFESDLIKENKASVLISANAVNGMKAGLSSAYLSRIIADFNQDIRIDLLQSTNQQLSPAFGITPLFRYNPLMKSLFNMIPAILVMLMSVVCGFLPALNIVAEKEKGTIEQMNVTPVSKFTLILAKLIPFWVVGFIALNICIFVAWLFYDFFPQGNLLTFYLFAAVFVLAMSGFGLVVSNYAKSIQQAVFIMFFFVLTFVFLSGLYTPAANMPDWAQLLSHISPLKYIILVVRLIYLKGSGFTDMLPQFFSLTFLALFFNTWAVLSYRKRKM
ncbi:MAG: Inner membrane transport permease YbhR [Bacteroidetes bacterium ADurb.Bin234]|jgi:ABC-2 type transport system permease protein|nr:MAG: Inner membrane transport permease YbhR [Bacteroidetes bacterium ADurb.Bin234]